MSEQHLYRVKFNAEGEVASISQLPSPGFFREKTRHRRRIIVRASNPKEAEAKAKTLRAENIARVEAKAARSLQGLKDVGVTPPSPDDPIEVPKGAVEAEVRKEQISKREAEVEALNQKRAEKRRAERQAMLDAAKADASS